MTTRQPATYRPPRTVQPAGSTSYENPFLIALVATVTGNHLSKAAAKTLRNELSSAPISGE